MKFKSILGLIGCSAMMVVVAVQQEPIPVGTALVLIFLVMVTIFDAALERGKRYMVMEQSLSINEYAMQIEEYLDKEKPEWRQSDLQYTTGFKLLKRFREFSENRPV